MNDCEVINTADDENELQKIVDKLESEFMKTENEFKARILELRKKNQFEEQRFQALMKQYFKLKEESEAQKKEVLSLMQIVNSKQLEQPRLPIRSPQKTGVYSPTNQPKLTSRSPNRNGLQLRKSFGTLAKLDHIIPNKEAQSAQIAKKDEKGRWKFAGSPLKNIQKKGLDNLRQPVNAAI